MSELESSFLQQLINNRVNIKYECETTDGDDMVYVIENSDGLIEFSQLNEGLDCLATISSLSNGSIEESTGPPEGSYLKLATSPPQVSSLSTEEPDVDNGEDVIIQDVVEEEVVAEGSELHAAHEIDENDLIQQILASSVSMDPLTQSIPNSSNFRSLSDEMRPSSPAAASTFFPCDYCNEKFVKRSHLVSHMIVHQSSQHPPHSCFKCSISFSRRSDFNTHMKIHSAENNDPSCSNNLLSDSEDTYTIPRRKRNNSTRSNTSIRSGSGGGGTSRRKYTLSTSSSTSSTRRRKNSSTRLDESFELDQLIKSAEKIRTTDSYNRSRWPVTNSSRPYVCQTCGLSFAREKALSNHSRIHSGDTPYECTICGESFWELSSLRDHTRARHFTTFVTSGREIFKSEKFGELDNTSLPAHEQYGDFPCHICGQMYYRLDQFQRHERTHQHLEDEDSRETDECPEVCTHCGMYFEHDELLEHVKLHQATYPGASCKSNNLLEKDLINRCVVCNAYFSTTELAVSHMKEVHGDELLDNICTICGRQFADESSLLSHECTGIGSPHSIHPENISPIPLQIVEPMSSPQRQVSRDSSPITTPSTAKKKVATSVFKCEVCYKTFVSQVRLKRHLLSHQVKSVMCDDCGEEFPDQKTLLVHKSRHVVMKTERGRIFACTVCGKEFNSRSSQQIHQRIHTGEKPYSCRFCWKSFADGGTLRKHERIHTGEKPYVCPICLKAFNQRVVLREHVRAHHSGPNTKSSHVYECKVCLQHFGSSLDLCQHIVQHSDENTAKHRVLPTQPRKYKRRRKLLPHEGDGFPDTDDEDEKLLGAKTSTATATAAPVSTSVRYLPPRKPTPEYDKEFLEWEMKEGINLIDKVATPSKSNKVSTTPPVTRKSLRRNASYASKYSVTVPTTRTSISSQNKSLASCSNEGLISLSSLAEALSKQKRKDRNDEDEMSNSKLTTARAEELNAPVLRTKRPYRRKTVHKINVELNETVQLDCSSTPKIIRENSLLNSEEDNHDMVELMPEECIAESFINTTSEVLVKEEHIDVESSTSNCLDVNLIQFHTCDMCSEVFADKLDLMSHIKIHM